MANRHKNHRTSSDAQPALTLVPLAETQQIAATSVTRLLLTTQEAMTALCLSRSSLSKLLLSGEIPSITVGRSRRIPLKALEEWIAHQLAA